MYREWRYSAPQRDHSCRRLIGRRVVASLELIREYRVVGAEQKLRIEGMEEAQCRDAE